jgi:glutathione S-transferase
MSLTLYWNAVSDPSRAVHCFIEANKIEHVEKPIDFQKGEHKAPDYLKVNPKGQVPSISDGDFNLSESATILRYLATTRKTPDHWYPADPKKRARVDEALDAWHTGIRAASLVVIGVGVFSRMTAPSTPLNREAWDAGVKKLQEQYKSIDEILAKRKFIGGDEISIADIQYACSAEWAQVFKLDLSAYPHLQKWLDSVRETSPGYKDVQQGFYGFMPYVQNTFAW